MTNDKRDEGVVLTDAQKRARRSRSIAIAVTLAALVILFYTLLLVPLGVSPWLLGYAGWLYAGTALISGATMLALAWQVYAERRPADKASKQLFAFSILYLFLLFAVLLVERGWDGILLRWTA